MVNLSLGPQRREESPKTDHFTENTTRSQHNKVADNEQTRQPQATKNEGQPKESASQESVQKDAQGKSFTEKLTEKNHQEPAVKFKAKTKTADEATDLPVDELLESEEAQKELKLLTSKQKESKTAKADKLPVDEDKDEDKERALMALAGLSVAASIQKPEIKQQAVAKTEEIAAVDKKATLSKTGKKEEAKTLLSALTGQQGKNTTEEQSSQPVKGQEKSLDLADSADESKGGKLELKAENGLTVKQDKKDQKVERVQATVQQEPIVIVADRRGAGNTSEVKLLNEQQQTADLASNLRESGNSQIVQRAQVILKEADSGEIRLTLKPENLGTVRINLNLEDNRVLGRIIVDNNAVKAAFDENMADLRDSMLKSGFNGAELNVSIGGRGADQQQSGGQQRRPFQQNGRLIEGQNAFNSESLNVIADIMNGSRSLNVQA